MPTITPDQLVKAGLADQATAERVAQSLEDACNKFGIETPEQVAQFLAQASHESGKFLHTSEGLNYRADRLHAIWPKRFPTVESATPYEHNPEAFANHVYGDRMGNQGEASGDGFKFIGRGYFQTTGRSNYQALADALNMPEIMDTPDIVAQAAVAALSAAFFWKSHNLNAHASDCEACTKVINGGLVGIDERTANYKSALEVMTA